ncbi:class I SAM-dependent methyltransferase [Sphingopyxis sp. KK2]|uniref:class I SAM-dependent methyltransferase n=1 Tax=Sphingopyxis sp. KK2 TaxID=1855727 RepID=UPI00097E6F46|nr:class I SAM-dependent methyltransferase [Sphingopyxis sp. KK2]
MLSRLQSIFSQSRKAGAAPFSSSKYWENRYVKGGNSGAGSYDRLADFKAEIIRDFLEKHDIQSVVEFGCGDGHQLSKIEYKEYVGVDVSPTILESVRNSFAHKENYSFVLMQDISRDARFDLSLSLDVIYHLIEDDVFDDYMSGLFDSSKNFVIIYSSNSDMAWPNRHVKHRLFSEWVERNRKDFDLVDHIPNKYPYSADDIKNTSFADFFFYKKNDNG